MRKAIAAAWIGLLLTGSVAAMDEESAREFLQGTWFGNSETWIFEGTSWTQYNGGMTTEGTYTVEAMPENLFIVVSGVSGLRYVVHANTTVRAMTWFAEGTTTQIGHYLRKRTD